MVTLLYAAPLQSLIIILVFFYFLFLLFFFRSVCGFTDCREAFTKFFSPCFVFSFFFFVTCEVVKVKIDFHFIAACAWAVASRVQRVGRDVSRFSAHFLPLFFPCNLRHVLWMNFVRIGRTFFWCLMDGTGCLCPAVRLPIPQSFNCCWFSFLLPRFVANGNLQHNSFGRTLVLV